MRNMKKETYREAYAEFHSLFKKLEISFSHITIVTDDETNLYTIFCEEFSECNVLPKLCRVHFIRSLEQWLKRHGFYLFVDKRSDFFHNEFFEVYQKIKFFPFIPAKDIPKMINYYEKHRTTYALGLNPFYDYLKKRCTEVWLEIFN